MHKFKPALVALSATPFVASPTASWAQSAPVSLEEEVVVTATRSERKLSEELSPTTVIDRQQIKESNAESTQEILQQRVPGLQISSNGGMGKSAGLHLRGTNSDHVLVLVNGVKQNSATMGGSAIQHIPLAQIERIEVVQGPRSSLYGSEALGGVIQIFTREGEEGFQPHAEAGYGSYETYRATAGVRGGTETTRYSANLGYVESEWIDVQEGNDQPDKDGYENRSASFSLKQEMGEGGQARVSLFRAEGTNEYDGSPNESDFVEQSAQAKYEQTLASLLVTSLQVGESRDETENLDAGDDFSHFDTRRTEASWENQLFLSDNQDLLVGVDYREDRVDTSLDYTEDSRENQAVFGHWKGSGERFQTEFGLRYDDNEAYGGHTTGDATLGYRLNDRVRMIASYGTAFKAPTFNDLFYPQKSGFKGNPDLDAETSRSAELGLIGNATWGAWEVRTFETRIDDLIQWEPKGGVWQPQNVDKARIRGLELSAEIEKQDWLVRPSLSFQDPENTGDSRQLSRRAEQIFKLDVQRKWGEWSLGSSVFAQSERFEYEDTDFDGEYDKTTELPAYGLLHLRGGYRFAPHWRVRAKVNNALDQDYQTAKGYSQPGRTYFVSVSYGAN